MRHPLPESPFPPTQFSQDECLSLRNLALSLVDECLDEYDDYGEIDNRTINKRKWKELKALESVAVYKRMTKEEIRLARTPMNSTASFVTRESSSSTSSSSGKSIATNFEWQIPRLLAVGKVVGTLDDVMYGIVSPDKEAMRVNTTYLDDECIDSRVLCSMQYPTEAKPFQFLGIKWVVRSQPSITRPRDLVFLESTGIKTRANGQQIGYWVQHSIDLPQYDELKALGIVRSRQSWVSVFRETAHGEVELYMQMLTDAGGNVSERLALQAAANTLMTVWKVPSCAHNKKLAWLMRDSSAKRSPQVVAKAKAERGKHCKLCTKSVSAFGTLTMCELCLHKVCSRCLTMRKLSYMRPTGPVVSVPTNFCKNCITRGAKTSAIDISILEYVPDAAPREPEIIETSEIFNTQRRRRDTRESTRSAPPANGSFISTPQSPPAPQASSLPEAHVATTLYESGRDGTPVFLRHEPPLHERVVIPPAYGRDHYAGPTMSRGNPTMTSPKYTPEPFRPDAHRRALWEQMTQLRIQAEEAYWQTKRNGYGINEIH